MNINTLHVVFNFRMTVPTDGTWNDVHRQNWKLIRPRVLQVQGVSGCRFQQASGEIYYYPNMTDSDTVLAKLQAIVDDLTNTAPSSFFPDHGDQRVIVSQDPARLPKTTNRVTITVIFPSDLFSLALPSYATVVEPVKKRMLHVDGARGAEVFINAASLTLDTGRTTPEAAKSHLRDVFNGLRTVGDYFPFYQGEGLILSFKVTENV